MAHPSLPPPPPPPPLPPTGHGAHPPCDVTTGGGRRAGHDGAVYARHALGAAAGPGRGPVPPRSARCSTSRWTCWRSSAYACCRGRRTRACARACGLHTRARGYRRCVGRTQCAAYFESPHPLVPRAAPSMAVSSRRSPSRCRTPQPPALRRLRPPAKSTASPSRARTPPSCVVCAERSAAKRGQGARARARRAAGGEPCGGVLLVPTRPFWGAEWAGHLPLHVPDPPPPLRPHAPRR